ncbi:MAG: esterase-like activity of phytase family protein [Sphingomicrobium sp.]
MRLHLEPLRIDGSAVAPLRLAGAWRLTADDSRFGGLSALALDKSRLMALSDTGVLARFDLPQGGTEETVTLADLPDGPGSPLLKKNRDSESLARDPFGRGWWVGFEQHNQLWLYDRAFRSGVRAIDFGRERWPRNLGIEAMLVDRGRITLVPESGNEVVDIEKGRAVSRPLRASGDRISDMARLPNGEMLVLLRDVGLTGFRNSLGVLEQDGEGWRVSRRVALRVGTFANLEGMAVQTLPSGVVRLWLVTDDNFQPPQTTMLIAIDIPLGGWPGRSRR